MADPRMSAQLEPEDLGPTLAMLQQFSKREPVIPVVQDKPYRFGVAMPARRTGDARHILVVLSKADGRGTEHIKVSEDKFWLRFRRSNNPKYTDPFEERNVVIVKDDHPSYRTLRARTV